MKKNTAGQKWRVFAFTRSTGAPVTSGAAAITAKLSKDYGAAVALTDTTPTETEDGYYLFDLTQAETNADDFDLYPESTTSGVQVIACPAHQSVHAVYVETAVDGTELTEAELLRLLASKLPYLDASVSAIKTKTDALISGAVTVTSPINAELDIEIVQRDAYSRTDTPALDWSSSDGDWFAGNISGAIVTFTAWGNDKTQILSKACSIVSATGTQLVRLELTGANTVLFTHPGKQYVYDVVIAKSGEERTIVSGGITIIQRPLVTA